MPIPAVVSDGGRVYARLQERARRGHSHAHSAVLRDSAPCAAAHLLRATVVKVRLSRQGREPLCRIPQMAGRGR